MPVETPEKVQFYDSTIAATIKDQILKVDHHARQRWGVQMSVPRGDGVEFLLKESRKIIIQRDVDGKSFMVSIVRKPRRQEGYIVEATADEIVLDNLVKVTDMLFARAFS